MVASVLAIPDRAGAKARALTARARQERIDWFTGLGLSQNRSMLHVFTGRERPSVSGTVDVRLHLAEVPD